MTEMSQSHNVEFKPNISPNLLAQKVLCEFGSADPAIDVFQIAHNLGIEQVHIDRNHNRCGSLQVIDDALAIVLRSADMSLQRFTAAHEIGHYLLSVWCGIPFKDQAGNRSVEKYCDRFAAALLIPRPWLTDVIDGPLDLDSIFDIADFAWCSEVVAARSVLEVDRSGRSILVWRPKSANLRNWKLSHCVGMGRFGRFNATSSACEVLRRVPMGQAITGSLHLTRDSQSVTIDAEMRRAGRVVLALVSAVEMRSDFRGER